MNAQPNEPEIYEWSREDYQAFFTASDVLFDACILAGVDGDEALDKIAFYADQRDSGEAPPEVVLNRMANATDRIARGMK